MARGVSPSRPLAKTPAMDAAHPARDAALSAPTLGARARPGSPPLLEPSTRGPAQALALRLAGRRPAAVFASAVVLGYAALVAVAIGVGFLLVDAILPGALGREDADANRWLAGERTPTLDDLSYVGSLIGDIPVLPGLVAVAVAALAVLRRFLVGAFLAAAGLVELATYRLTGLVVERERPPVPRLDDHLPMTQSYPSGHVAASVAVYGALALVVASSTRRRQLVRLAWALAILLPAVVAASRLYRGMHHPTDVVAGALVGIGAIGVALLAARACRAAAVGPRRGATGEEAR